MAAPTETEATVGDDLGGVARETPTPTPTSTPTPTHAAVVATEAGVAENPPLAAVSSAIPLRPEETTSNPTKKSSDRRVSSTVSRTHSQSRSTMGRRLQQRLRGRVEYVPSHAAGAGARRLQQLNAFSHAELLVLQALVVTAVLPGSSSSDGAALLLTRHPFLSRQRETLASVLSATTPLGARLLDAVKQPHDQRDRKLRRTLLVDYPAWRKKHFAASVDRRLRLKRGAFARLFPGLAGLPAAARKRVFAVFDRNASGKIEFSELCETLARCWGKMVAHATHSASSINKDDDERIAVVFEWFMEKHALHVTRNGVAQLEAVLRAIERYFKLPTTRVMTTRGSSGELRDATTTALGELLLRGQTTVGFEAFYDAMVQLPQVLDVLMRPFDIVAPVVAEGQLLQLHEKTEWKAGDAAYVVDASWWNRWISQTRARRGIVDISFTQDRSASPLATGSYETFGPITNASLCGSDVAGVLKPELRLGEDFVLVSDAVWRKLVLLHGGGPELPRKIVAQTTVAEPSATEQVPGIDSADQEEGTVAVNERVRVFLYPLVLYIRLMKTDTIQTSLLLARRFMLSPVTKLKEILHRLGISPGGNVQSVSFWMRRHRWDVWRRIECSLDAPRSSLELVGLQSGHELIIDFKPFGGAATTKNSGFADNRFVLSLYQPVGNDFVCLEAGIDCAMTSLNWTAQPTDVTDEAGNTSEKHDEDQGRGAELYTGGHTGLITSAGFSVNMNDQFKFKKKPLARLVKTIDDSGAGGGGIRATGLLNMGNTCFLNCAIQCLGHSPILREYFLSQRFIGDINKVNVLGTKGKIAAAYSKLLDTLWSQLKEPQTCFAPAGFRDEFARHRTQFQESSQHDAHEFIVSLLDSLHEDLNRRRGGRSEPRGGGLLCMPFSGSSGVDAEDDDVASAPGDSFSTGSASDEVVGSSAWQAHSRVNSSVVVDLFHGQMRSETVCSSCDERKVTFDPFLFFSVPIPEPKFLRVEVKIILQVRPLEADSVSLKSFPPTRQGFWLPRCCKVADLCEQIGQEHGIAARRFVIVEVRRNRIKRIFDEADTLEVITPFRDLYAFERAWSVDDIPRVPEYVVRSFGEPVDTDTALTSGVRGFADLRVGSRVDGVGYHGDWHPGSVIGVSDTAMAPGTPAPAAPSNVISRVLIHFDAFSSKWDKWFAAEDWAEGNLQPVHTRTKQSVEVFEVQVVHRRVIPMQKASYMHSFPRGPRSQAEQTSSVLEVFGVPMFVTIGSNRSANDLHGAILLQASRFIAGFAGRFDEQTGVESVPYEAFVVDLDDVGSLQGKSLPKDSSCVLQHFATQSVVVLDWILNAYSETEQLLKDTIPDEMAELEREHLRTKSSDSILSNSTSLTSCLDALFKAEEISLDDHWNCDRCGIKRAGTRRSDVWKLPDLVMIQLKRFQYQENGYRQKVRTMVDFPLQGLDFSQWMGKEGSGNHGGADPSCVYDLYAVANHVGGLARGHYTAYCKYDCDFEESARAFSTLERARHHSGGTAELEFNDVWYRFDDEKVVEIAPADIPTEAAYVLFYKRRKMSPHNVLAYAM